MNLSNLKPAPGSRKKSKRVGRGNASGHGNTSGRGAKGQKARSGGAVPPYFEGGQMPIYRRLPKRGFKNPFRKEYGVINLADLRDFEANSVIDYKTLREKGKISSAVVLVKLLAKGEIDVPLSVRLNKASQAAIDKIVKAGGTFEAV
ncbi:MAG TPA: 50S ribosomal protein L15 [Deltaproteobacteria bacterium]|nr:50S ribosomal protein L15 [Desulfomonilia bacterium]HDP24216.1 50S ribosomal protein L15 [Deltaproteobacteria bacterium]